MLHITDAPTHQPIEYEDFFPGTHTLEEAATALQAIDARAISIVSGACARRSVPCNEGPTVRARDELERLALTTGAFTDVEDNGECPHGIDGAAPEPREDVCPLVFDVSDEGEGLAETFTTAITTLVDGIRFERVTAVAPMIRSASSTHKADRRRRRHAGDRGPAAQRAPMASPTRS